MTGRTTRAWFAALLLSAMACGGGPPPPEGQAEGPQRTAGAETSTPEPTSEAEIPGTDPCVEGTEEPCPEEGVDSPDAAITEGSGPDLEDVEPEEGETGEGVTDAGSDATGADPRVAWRNQVGAGRAVFERVCGVCHPGGEEDIGPDIRRRRLPVARVTRIIRNGTGRMRPISQRKLPDRYVDELMAYLSVLGTVSGVQRPQ